MKPGDLVRWAFPQADGVTKQRPAILLVRLSPFGDWLICAVSTSLGQYVETMDLMVDEGHPDFVTMRLPKPSLIRTGMLDTIPTKSIKDVIGRVGATTVRTLRTNLAQKLLQDEDLSA